MIDPRRSRLALPSGDASPASRRPHPRMNPLSSVAPVVGRGALAGLVFSLAVACGTRTTTADSASPTATAADAAATAPSVAPPPKASASAASSAPAASNGTASAASAEPPSIPCTSEDECWVDEARNPVPRPKAKRGVKLRPCKDTEHVPACVSGACVVRHLKC